MDRANFVTPSTRLSCRSRKLPSINIQTWQPIGHEHFKTYVFIGANQTRVPTDFADALDFHIAFYIGQLAAADPKGFFHVISKDTGFDPLITHLKGRKILAGRVRSIDEIPLVKTNGAMTREAKIECIVARLQQMKAAKPRTAKTLSSTISALFQKQLPEKEIEALVKALQKQSLIDIDDKKVTYSLA